MILNTLILNRVEKFDAAPEPRVWIAKKVALQRGGGVPNHRKKVIIYVRRKESPGGELKNNSYLYINCRNVI